MFVLLWLTSRGDPSYCGVAECRRKGTSLSCEGKCDYMWPLLNNEMRASNGKTRVCVMKKTLFYRFIWIYLLTYLQWARKEHKVKGKWCPWLVLIIVTQNIILTFQPEPASRSLVLWHWDISQSSNFLLYHKAKHHKALSSYTADPSAALSLSCCTFLRQCVICEAYRPVRSFWP